jgi:hypothetical protein
MSVTLALNVDQLKTLIGQCNLEEKIELIRYLEKETFESRFRQLLKNFKTDELTFEEITQEVENIRQKRYEKTN